MLAFEDAPQNVRSVAFSPDGKTLAVGLGDVDHGFKLFGQPTEPVLLESLPGVTGAQPARPVLVHGYSGSGGAVVLWDMTRQEWLTDKPLHVAEGEVVSLAFSQDGKTLAAGFEGFISGGGLAVANVIGGVVLWNVDPETWKHHAGLIANRNLTRAEWRRYFPGENYRPTFDHLPVPP